MKQMKRMEEILAYILEHLDTVTLEETAKAFGYNEAYLARIFREYFEYPFHKYVMKLRLRKAAQSMYDLRSVGTIGSDTGYRYLPGFSQAFKKEFGYSPRTFLKKKLQVPDMPLLSKLDGVSFFLHYDVIPAKTVYGHRIYPKKGNDADLMEEAAYGFMEGYGEGDDHFLYGIWDSDEEGNRIYFMGRTFHENEDKSGLYSLSIPKGQYAIFRIPIAGSRKDSLIRQRKLVRYVFMEWLLINRKVANRMGITYEFFDKDWTGICIPLIKGMYGYESVMEEKWYGDQWISYINEHIRENLTTERLAGYFNYSETIFRTTFFTKYGMTAADYIQKRRLILAAEEIERGKGNPERIAKKYGFSSLERLKELFYQSFDLKSEEVGSVDFSLINLPDYYESNRQRFRINFRRMEDFLVEGKRIDSIQEENVYDIHELTSYWFHHLSKECNEDIYALWDGTKDEKSDKFSYAYFVGKEAKDKRINHGRNQIHVTGGGFAVFETIDPVDDDALKEKYAMLERCAFYTWIKENRIRYDEKRITFVAYRGRKLYFYVPVIK